MYNQMYIYQPVIPYLISQDEGIYTYIIYACVIIINSYNINAWC